MVCVFVCLLIIFLSPAERAEPCKMPIER